jgi:hypothetical protein
MDITGAALRFPKPNPLKEKCEGGEWRRRKALACGSNQFLHEPVVFNQSFKEDVMSESGKLSR